MSDILSQKNDVNVTVFCDRSACAVVEEGRVEVWAYRYNKL